MTGKIKTFGIQEGTRLVCIRWKNLRPVIFFIEVTKVNSSSIFLGGVRLSKTRFESLGFGVDIKAAFFSEYGALMQARQSHLRMLLTESIGGVLSDNELLLDDDETDAIICEEVKGFKCGRRLRVAAIARLRRLESTLEKRGFFK